MTIVLGRAIYPHVRIVEWEAPSIAVAQRWADEVNGRYVDKSAIVLSKWNGAISIPIVQVSEKIDRSVPTTET